MKRLMELTTLLVCLTTSTQTLLAQDEALKILPNGNVGIGVATPLEPLHVNGNIKAEGRIEDRTGIISPVGSIMIFAGNIAPPGWLLCDGASYDINGDKNELFQVIGSIYGRTASKFNVPDLRERFVMGADSQQSTVGVGNKGEADQHNHVIDGFEKIVTTSTVGAHTHKFPQTWHVTYFDGYRFRGIGVDTDNIQYATTSADGAHDHSVLFSFPATGSSFSKDPNRPKWMSLNYIIKY